MNFHGNKYLNTFFFILASNFHSNVYCDIQLNSFTKHKFSKSTLPGILMSTTTRDAWTCLGLCNTNKNCSVINISIRDLSNPVVTCQLLVSDTLDYMVAPSSNMHLYIKKTGLSSISGTTSTPQTTTFLETTTEPSTVIATSTEPSTEATTVIATTPLTCPTGYSVVGSSCYKVVIQAMTWDQARTYCLAEGANLVSVKTQQVFDDLKAFIDSLPARDCTDPLNWALQRQKGTSPVMKTSCGFMDSSPQSSLENCLNLVCSTMSSRGYMYDSIFTYSSGSACHVRACSGDPDVSLGSTSTSYDYDNYQFIDHKFWTSGAVTGGSMTWDDGTALDWSLGDLQNEDGTQDCLVLLTDFAGYHFNDERCHFKYNFICEVYIL